MGKKWLDFGDFPPVKLSLQEKQQQQKKKKKKLISEISSKNKYMVGGT